MPSGSTISRWSHIKVGDVLMAQGNLAEALKSYRDGLAVADRLAKSDPENVDWQRNSLHSHTTRSAMRWTAGGNLTEALKKLSRQPGNSRPPCQGRPQQYRPPARSRN